MSEEAKLLSEFVKKLKEKKSKILEIDDLFELINNTNDSYEKKIYSGIFDLLLALQHKENVANEKY